MHFFVQYCSKFSKKRRLRRRNTSLYLKYGFDPLSTRYNWVLKPLSTRYNGHFRKMCAPQYFWLAPPLGVTGGWVTDRFPKIQSSQHLGRSATPYRFLDCIHVGRSVKGKKILKYLHRWIKRKEVNHFQLSNALQKQKNTQNWGQLMAKLPQNWWLWSIM